MGDTEHKSSGGGGQGNQQGAGGQKKKESILDLSKYLDKTVGIKFQGGREATGILKGYDNLLNVVLDNTRYFLHVYAKYANRQFVYPCTYNLKYTAQCPL